MTDRKLCAACQQKVVGLCQVKDPVHRAIYIAENEHQQPQARAEEGALWLNHWSGELFVRIGKTWKQLPLPHEQLIATLCSDCCVRSSAQPVDCAQDEFLVCTEVGIGKCKHRKLERKKLVARQSQRPIDCKSDELLVCVNNVLEARPLALQEDNVPINCLADSFLVCSSSIVRGQTACQLRSRQLSIDGSARNLSCEDAFLVCSTDGSLVTVNLPSTASDFDCGETILSGVANDKFLVCDAENQVQQRRLSLDPLPFNCQSDTLLACSPSGLVTKAFAVGTGGLLTCDDALLTCDASGSFLEARFGSAAQIACTAEFLVCAPNGELQRAPVPTSSSSINCTAEFVVCEGDSFVRKSIGGDLVAVRCEDSFLVCDASTGELRQRSLGTSGQMNCRSELLVCQNSSIERATIEQQLGVAVRCDDGFLVCDASSAQLVERKIATASQLFCNNELVFCDGSSIRRAAINGDAQTNVQCSDGFIVCDGSSGALVERKIAGNGNLLCSDRIVVCDGSNFKQASFASQAATLDCESEFLFCTTAGAVASRSIPSAAEVLCTAEFLVCDGAEYQRASIATGPDLLCDDEFVVCNNNSYRRSRIEPADTQTLFSCTETNVLFCNRGALTQKRLEYLFPVTGSNDVQVQLVGENPMAFVDFEIRSIPFVQGKCLKVSLCLQSGPTKDTPVIPPFIPNRIIQVGKFPEFEDVEACVTQGRLTNSSLDDFFAGEFAKWEFILKPNAPLNSDTVIQGFRARFTAIGNFPPAGVMLVFVATVCVEPATRVPLILET